jgi:hypothetical protein
VIRSGQAGEATIGTLRLDLTARAGEHAFYKNGSVAYRSGQFC